MATSGMRCPPTATTPATADAIAGVDRRTAASAAARSQPPSPDVYRRTSPTAIESPLQQIMGESGDEISTVQAGTVGRPSR